MTSAALCLALAVYYEARSEPLDGQIAVAEVVINRVESDRFPDDVCSVVTHNKHPQDLHRCQFSFYCDGKPERPGDMIAWQRSQDVADGVLNGSLSLGIMATHYHADYAEPVWVDDYAYHGRIGTHLYYE